MLASLTLQKNNTLTNKTHITHFRKETIPQTEYQFHLCDISTDTVDSYTYLGLLLNYALHFTSTVEMLSKASSKALG